MGLLRNLEKYRFIPGYMIKEEMQRDKLKNKACVTVHPGNAPSRGRANSASSESSRTSTTGRVESPNTQINASYRTVADHGVERSLSRPNALGYATPSRDTANYLSFSAKTRKHLRSIPASAYRIRTCCRTARARRIFRASRTRRHRVLRSQLSNASTAARAAVSHFVYTL
ncbi:hypothetical protein PUN28_017990 [Cardiocondyla obscurior]|uniref:Uncharacterized protein n=1 Tax=Cardiocondyla obscurior TaxID=286306 RepID=A0AAW2EJ74_9HYME